MKHDYKITIDWPLSKKKKTTNTVTSHIWMHHVSPTNASCRAYECVMSHLQMRHVALTNAHVALTNWSCCAYELIMLHLRMRHVALTNASWYTYECVMWRLRMRHVALTNASCRTYECSCCAYECSCVAYQRAVPHIWKHHLAHLNVSFLECVIFRMCRSSHINASCRYLRCNTCATWAFECVILHI